MEERAARFEKTAKTFQLSVRDDILKRMASIHEKYTLLKRLEEVEGQIDRYKLDKAKETLRQLEDKESENLIRFSLMGERWKLKKRLCTAQINNMIKKMNKDQYF